MGRWYYGEIHGKCWFGIQDSNDASCFGVEPKQEFRFDDCGCLCEPDDLDDSAYCDTCYETFEEHLEAIKEQIDPNATKTWSIDESGLDYEFGEDDLPTVKKVVKELKKEVGDYIKKIKFNYNNPDGISYNIELTDENLDDDIQEKIARLCLGMQIIKSITRNGTCCFNVET